RDRHGRSHFRIAEAREGADKSRENEREADGRTGIGGRGMAGQDKDAGADDAANAKRDNAGKRKRPAQPRFTWHRPEFAGLCFGLKDRDRLAYPNIRHSTCLPWAVWPIVMIG